MAPDAAVRWRLTTPLPALWRSASTLQLGVEPPAGLLLSDPPSGVREVIEALAAPRDRQALMRAGGPSAPAWLDTLLQLLHGAGLAGRVPETPPAVTVIGDGRFAVLVSELMLGATDASLRLVWPGSPVEPRPVRTLRNRFADRLAYAGHWGYDSAQAGALTVVVVQAPEPDRSLLSHLVADGQPFLVVRASDAHTSVGPLVAPGRAPCPRCEDLHRTARDPAWPRLLAQLCRKRPPAGLAEQHWAAGTAVLHAEAWLAGALPDSLGASLELGVDRQLRLRGLRAHPGCGCLAFG